MNTQQSKGFSQRVSWQLRNGWRTLVELVPLVFEQVQHKRVQSGACRSWSMAKRMSQQAGVVEGDAYCRRLAAAPGSGRGTTPVQVATGHAAIRTDEPQDQKARRLHAKHAHTSMIVRCSGSRHGCGPLWKVSSLSSSAISCSCTDTSHNARQQGNEPTVQTNARRNNTPIRAWRRVGDAGPRAPTRPGRASSPDRAPAGNQNEVSDFAWLKGR